MSTYKNVSGGVLILPDNTEIKDGATVQVSEKDMNNSGVKSWIKSGLLKSNKIEKQANQKSFK